MIRNNGIDDCKTKSGSLFLGGKVRFKQEFFVFSADSIAIVGNFNAEYFQVGSSIQARALQVQKIVK